MRSKPSKRYWAAYGALYGNGEPLPPRKPKVASTTPTEAQEQVKAATWLAKNKILFYHVPNGGYRNPIEAVKFKRMGVFPGVPDICIPISRKGHHGLYIELKREKGGILSEHQQYWMTELKKNGYDVFEAHGSEELIRYVKNYMEVPPHE